MRRILLTIIAVVVTVGALYAMQHSTPYYSDIVSMVKVKGEQGKPLSTAKFTIGVADSYIADQLVTSSFGTDRNYTSSGKWLVLEAAARADKESINLMSALWQGPSGAQYSMSQRITNAWGLLGSERLEPGIPRPVLLIFELPEREINGGSLLVAESLITPLAQQAEIRINPLDASHTHPAILIKRGGRIQPWALEVQ
ncbi:hypothetical protein BRY73_22640 [Ochrobactrum sp. P6BS-III]|uniref:hypothetical protein n=1 Tax=unclassified Ochrobactrum TaxID=239106 RepID=UPI000994170C|nr:hypothetical protein [Ochrobactrum sp. P6BSIII]OOL14796.1 hypothetical protein BRY73_22640 [Ochrobactrum sp. P6BS-III]